MNIVTRAKSTA